jgi:Tfp pilus assembly protein PilF
MDKPTHSATEYFDFDFQLMGREDWASATQMFRAAVQLDPSSAQAYAGLGTALGNQGLRAGLWTSARKDTQREGGT